MNNHQDNLKVYNVSKLLVIGLSIILITGISLVSTLEIQVQGQVQQQQAPTTPPSPGGSPASGNSPPPPVSSETPPSPGGSPASGNSPPSALDTADGGAVNQSTTIMIPQSSVMTMLNNLQTAMDAVADDEDAMKALESVDQELKSAANASGISIQPQQVE